MINKQDKKHKNKNQVKPGDAGDDETDSIHHLGVSDIKYRK